MAEHDLKLVISADTSEAEKKLKDIGKTKVPPVQIDVTAEKVKIDAPNVDPVKVPVSAEKISIETPKVDPVKVPVSAEKISIETPKVDPVKVPVTVDATSSSRQIKEVVDSISDATRTSRPQIKPTVETPTVTAKVETPVVTPEVKTPEPVKATIIEPPPVEPKVVQPKPVTVTVGIKDEQARKRLEEITAEHKIPCKVVGVDKDVGDKIQVEFIPNDAKVKNALREITSREDVVVVGMRADFEEAKSLYAELKKPIETTVKPKVDQPVVKPTVEQPKPVTVEAKAKKVVVEVSDAEAKKKIENLTKDESVKRVRVVTERGDVADRKNGKERFEIEFTGDDSDVRRKIDALKADNRINFVATSSGFGAVQSQILGIRTAITKAMQALGTIGVVVGIVMAVAEGFKWLKDKIEESSKAVAKLRFDLQMREAASETNRLVSAHERLANVLKDELDTLNKQKAVGDIGKQGKRDLEDGRRAADRARQIYEAKTPEEEQSMRDRFAREDAQIATRRRQEDRRERIIQLDEEESAYTAKAKGARENQAKIDEQIKDEELNVRRARGSRKDSEEMGEAEKDARARVESLKKAKEANDLAIQTYEKEAKFRRDQIAALQGVRDADGAEAVAIEQRQREKEKARENDRTTTKADREWKNRQQREAEKKSVDDAVESQGTNTANKRSILTAQAENRRTAANALRGEYEAEMKKQPATRDAERLAELRGKIDALEAEADSYEKRCKDITRDENTKRAGELESFADRINAADGVSQNRLTAMGLGSGVTAKGDVSSDVRKLVDLLRQNVDATKSIKIPEPSSTGVFAE